MRQKEKDSGGTVGRLGEDAADAHEVLTLDSDASVVLNIIKFGTRHAQMNTARSSHRNSVLRHTAQTKIPDTAKRY